MVTLYNRIEGILEQPADMYLTTEQCLERIRNGTVQETINKIRGITDEVEQMKLKRQLSAISFSGKFSKRGDKNLIEHSGLICLDFDHLTDIERTKSELILHPYIFACWVSPSGHGLKALVKISDTENHKGHFDALKNIFPEIDPKCRNVERLCFESFDPEIYINYNAEIFMSTVEEKKFESTIVKQFLANKSNGSDIVRVVANWLTKKGEGYGKGNRNNFIFLFAGACCRFGLNQDECIEYCVGEYAEHGFDASECETTIKSAYRQNHENFGTEIIENGKMVNKISKKETNITDLPNAILDIENEYEDIHFLNEDEQDELARNGYPDIKGIGVDELDNLFKLVPGELTLIVGHQNGGKSTFINWFLLMRAIVFDEKIAIFSPESGPARDIYHSLIERLLGCEYGPNNGLKPNWASYEKARDFIKAHFFVVQCDMNSPTPAYVKKLFKKLIDTYQVAGVLIDPFNTLDHDYKTLGIRQDLYLEEVFETIKIFTRKNNIFTIIVIHSISMPKDAEGNYRCPQMQDVSGGMTPSRKAENTLVYHRPFNNSDKNSPICEIHSQKLRFKEKNKVQSGTLQMSYSGKARRYLIDNVDYMAKALQVRDIGFATDIDYAQTKDTIAKVREKLKLK